MRATDPDEFIDKAIQTGSRNGIEALDADQRFVYLVSEAEVYCDMQGINGFLDRYSPRWIEETAAAFAELGASEIATTFRRIAANTTWDDQLLEHITTLIARRSGYNYDTIRRAIKTRIMDH
jgi:hypothetical protein